MLKTYLDEWKEYPDLGKRRPTCVVDTNKIFNKIRKHFKINAILRTSNRKRGGTSYDNGIIKIGNCASLDTIAHELAHNLERQKYGSTGHTKRFRRTMLKIVKYIRRKNYWEDKIKYTVEISFEDRIQRIDERYKERKKERCSKGGIHHWFGADKLETLDTINKKQLVFNCGKCQEIKYEDWSNSNVNWEEKLKEVLK